jgi:uncharacterized membrane protein
MFAAFGDDGSVTRYDAWLLLHIVAATVWAGGAVVLGAVAFSAERFRKPVELGHLAPINAWVGVRVFTPASLAAFVTGTLLVLDGPWTMGQLWIVLALAGFLLTFLPGFLVISPETKRIHAAIVREGPHGPEVRRRVRRVLLVSRATTVVLLFVIADMVVKPSAEDVWVLAAGGALLAAALAGLVLLGRTAARAAAPEAPAAAPR